jgi:SAM-dependent methyltransferase
MMDGMRKDEQHLGGYIGGGDPNTWYPRIWNWARRELGVRSVLDVGCGEGHSTRYFRELGCEVLGVEGSSEAQRHSVIPDRLVLHDFTTGPFIPDRMFDLVWSCEFVEHIGEQHARNFLAAFATSTTFVIMTHALPGQRGYHHVNCQPSRYWVRRLKEIGFDLDYRLTRRARALGHAYFLRSGLVFVKSPGARRPTPTSLLLTLLSLESFGRRAFRYVRHRGLMAAMKRLFRAP